MPIKTVNKKNNKNRKPKRQNRPSVIRLSGVPPIMLIKTPEKKYNKINKNNNPKKGKIEPQIYVYQVSPL